MKQILVIDESPLFREYLRAKLSENGIDVTVALNALDGITKLRNTIPDLVILDYNLGRQGCLEVLKQKRNSPNTINIPVIIMAQHIDQKKIIELVPFNVKKIFNKPVKIDALFAVLTEMLGIPFVIDETPGIVEVHINDDIIMVEIAMGLNRDKLDLLRFKIIELIELYQIKVPKIIVMLSDLVLSFADGPNIQKLLDIVIQASKAKRKNIRILTRVEFTRQFIESQKEYEDIEVVSNLQYAMDGLLAELHSNMEYGEKKAEIIGEKLAAANTGNEDMALRFDGETRFKADDVRETLQNLHIAAVDDDFVIQEIIKNTFEKAGAHVDTYSDGAEFTEALNTESFDMIFLDLLMPRMDGFAVLRELQDRRLTQPVIVLSAVTQRETVIRAYQMGVKSYLVKPLKPDDIFKKSLEILRVNF